MADPRQDLLHVLRRAYALAQDVERSLKQFSDRHAGQAALAGPVTACLTQTLDQQRMLAECLRRIDNGTPLPPSSQADSTAVRPLSADRSNQSTDDAVHELTRIHVLVLQEIDVYSSGIATAESGGFFETRLVCEGILLQKSTMAAWLSRATNRTAV
ncbi:DUF892 family protein [Paraburkholderia flava]|uniref:DUF892 family protein n=1 Tax=Paraburkholderia flava TaxID=2547393 RepID=UPI001061EC28|nr:DUF892 family protein [Paraburkholderia flava]